MTKSEIFTTKCRDGFHLSSLFILYFLNFILRHATMCLNLYGTFLEIQI